MQANKDLALSPGSHTVKHVSITKKRKFEKEQFYTLVYFDPETTGFGKKNHVIFLSNTMYVMLFLRIKIW